MVMALQAIGHLPNVHDSVFMKDWYERKLLKFARLSTDLDTLVELQALQLANS